MRRWDDATRATRGSEPSDIELVVHRHERALADSGVDCSKRERARAVACAKNTPAYGCWCVDWATIADHGEPKKGRWQSRPAVASRVCSPTKTAIRWCGVGSHRARGVRGDYRLAAVGPSEDGGGSAVWSIVASRATVDAQRKGVAVDRSWKRGVRVRVDSTEPSSVEAYPQVATAATTWEARRCYRRAGYRARTVTPQAGCAPRTMTRILMGRDTAGGFTGAVGKALRPGAREMAGAGTLGGRRARGADRERRVRNEDTS